MTKFQTVEQLQTEIELLRSTLRNVLSWAEPIAGDASNLTEQEILWELRTVELARAALQPKEGN